MAKKKINKKNKNFICDLIFIILIIIFTYFFINEALKAWDREAMNRSEYNRQWIQECEYQRNLNNR